MFPAQTTADAMLAGMEAVLLGSPDDVCLHRAYASVLITARDPARAARGRFIETQIKLEDASLSAEQRKRLEGRRRKFFQDHGRAWLDELAGLLLDRPGHRLEMRRGWLDAVIAPALCPELLAALVRAPLARLLRRLVIEQDDPAERHHLAVLLEAPFLPHLIDLRLGPLGAGEAPRDVLHRLLV